MEYGWGRGMKNLSTQEILQVLRKVLISSENVKEEDLELFMENSEQIDSEVMYQLLLASEKQMKEEELLRIMRHLPKKHQLHLELFLPLGSLLDPKKERLYALYKKSMERQNDKRRFPMR